LKKIHSFAKLPLLLDHSIYAMQKGGGVSIEICGGQLAIFPDLLRFHHKFLALQRNPEAGLDRASAAGCPGSHAMICS
jgi:hypothetical protein